MIIFSLDLNIILIFEHDYKIIASIISLYEVQKDKKNQEEYNNKSHVCQTAFIMLETSEWKRGMWELLFNRTNTLQPHLHEPPALKIKLESCRPTVRPLNPINNSPDKDTKRNQEIQREKMHDH